MNILFLASNFPDPVNKTWAPWNKRAIDSVLGYASPTVVVPRPFAPPFSRFARIPARDLSQEYPIYYPRFFYPLPKSLFYCFTGEFYRYFIGRFIEKALNNGELIKPDIIHALHPYLDGYGGVSIAKKLDVPLVVTVHSPNNLQICPEKVLSTLKDASIIITIAEFLKRDLIDLSIPEEKVKHISLGVDPQEFKPLKYEDLKIITQKYKTKPEDIIILYVGQLIPRKNLKTLLKAIPIVLQSLSQETKENVKFVIVGGGPEEKKLKKLALELNINNHVIFTGRVSFGELKEWYGIADIFVLPSLSEGKPVAIYEAMSSECAIIASDINGIPEQVFESINGFLISPNDTQNLAEKILYLLENPQELERMKKGSRQLLFKLGYTWESYGQKIKQIYNSLIPQNI